MSRPAWSHHSQIVPVGTVAGIQSESSLSLSSRRDQSEHLKAARRAGRRVRFLVTGLSVGSGTLLLTICVLLIHFSSAVESTGRQLLSNIMYASGTTAGFWGFTVWLLGVLPTDHRFVLGLSIAEFFICAVTTLYFVAVNVRLSADAAACDEDDKDRDWRDMPCFYQWIVVAPGIFVTLTGIVLTVQVWRACGSCILESCLTYYGKYMSERSQCGLHLMRFFCYF